MCNAVAVKETPTFQNRIHSLSVQGGPHPHEEQFFWSLRKVVDKQFRVWRDGFHRLVDGFAPNLCRHQVDCGAEDVGDSEEAHPVAVAHPPVSAAGDFIVTPEAVAYLKQFPKNLRFHSSVIS